MLNLVRIFTRTHFLEDSCYFRRSFYAYVPKCYLPFVFIDQNFLCVSYQDYMRYIPHPSQLFYMVTDF